MTEAQANQMIRLLALSVAMQMAVFNNDSRGLGAAVSQAQAEVAAILAGTAP